MTTNIIAILLLIGFVAGLLSGLIGVGGGIILVPALLYFFKYSQSQAQGTSLGVLALPVAFVAFYFYYKQLKGTENAINPNVIFALAIGFIIGGLLGGKIAVKLNQETLKKIFGIVLLFMALRMLDVTKYIEKIWK